MGIDCTKRYIAGQRLASKEIGGESVVLNLDTGNFYGLNNTAARVWNWLQEARTLDELEVLLTNEFEVDSALARAELTELLNSMEQRKLIHSVG